MNKLVKIFLSVLIIITLTGCNNKDKKEVNGLAYYLLQKITFVDELIKIDDDTVKSLYEITDFIAQEVYISSGATAEEIAIISFSNDEDTNKGIEKAKKRIEILHNSFKDYIPSEIPKIENAFIEKIGHNVVVCISDNMNVVEIVNEFIK